MPYAERLAADLGFTSLHLRYNSGLHVSQNGRAFARQLDRLLDAYPRPFEEIVLIGHSMGGLVARSACHIGARRQAAWSERVSNVVCLGTPHLGAPLEKVVHVASALLDATSLGRPWAHVLKSRSAGIKDLRWGYVADEHWRGRDPDALLDNGRTPIPRVPHVRYHFIGSTFGDPENSLLAHAVGDGMVRLPSSTAHELADADTAVLAGINHMRLLNHPAVYGEIRARLG
jgi:pimeloyl-ACP methyl ester carboxylesterase